MITIEYNLSKPDVVAATCNYYSGSPWMKKRVRAVHYGVTIVFAGLASLAFVLIPDKPGLGIYFLAFAILMGVGYPAWYRRAIRRNAERLFAESRCEKFFGKQSLTLSEDGIAATSPIHENRMKWIGVHRVDLTKDYLFVYLANIGAYAISRSQVVDSTILEAKKFIEARVTPSTQK